MHIDSKISSFIAKKRTLLRLNPFYIVMSIAFLSLCFFSILLIGYKLHFIPPYLNDQTSFISVARHLVDYGHFILKDQYQGIGNIIMPGLLNTENTRLYMPGYYLVLALFYWLLGYSDLTFILPSMMAYLGTTALIFFLAKKLYGRNIALISSFLFIFFPLNILFAFNAMSEMNVVFFSLLTFVIIVLLPKNFRPFLTPFLLALPYLFRQTGMLLLIPVLAYLYDEKTPGKLWGLLIIAVSSLGIFHFIDVWQGHQGLYGINLIHQLIAGHGVDYSNAFPEQSNSNHSFPYLILYRFYVNLHLFFNNLRAIDQKSQFILIISMFEIFCLILTSLYMGVAGIKEKKWFPISCHLLVIAIFFACLILYIGVLITLQRIIMFTLPFAIIQCARFLSFQIKTKSSDYLFYISFFFYFYFSITLLTSTVTAADFRSFDRVSRENTKFLESIHPDSNKVFIAQFEIAADYVYQHYPELIAFVPDNKETLQLLDKKFPIGTFLIDEEAMYKITHLTVDDIISSGFVYIDRPVYHHRNYLLFRKK